MHFATTNSSLPIGNGGGTCKTLEDVHLFCKTSISMIEIGSITEEARLGNTGNTFHNGSYFTLNSIGMTNGGRPYYEKNLAEMTKIIREAGKKSIVNVAGFSPKEYSNLTRLAFDEGADYVTLNFGCPNVWGDGKQKGIVSHDPPTMKKILSLVLAENPEETKQGRAGIKYSPMYPSHIDIMGNFLNSFVLGPTGNYIGFVVNINTVPNCSDRTGDEVSITPARGLAGMAGQAIGPIARGQVQQFREILHPNIRIIGVGGVETAEDVQKMLKYGADFVQATSIYFKKNYDVGVYEELCAEFALLEQQKEHV